MKDSSNPSLTPRASKLRKQMTPQERRLWYDFLKKLPVTVHRQKVIGPYIADFYIASRQLVIELDGKVHHTPEQIEYDRKRDAYMQRIGLKVIRYADKVIDSHFAGVCAELLTVIGVEQTDLKVD